MSARLFAALLGLAAVGLFASRVAPLAAQEKAATATGPAADKKGGSLGGSIEVDMVGTIKTGVIQPGGETTGTTITSLGLTWELDFQGNKENALIASKLHGREGSVKGTLTVKEGVEVKRRYIVMVKQIRELTR
jgi:hypothetical protein